MDRAEGNLTRKGYGRQKRRMPPGRIRQAETQDAVGKNTAGRNAGCRRKGHGGRTQTTPKKM
ncbi:MAG: hypothetical protein NC409_01285 [Clostridium sp.]|nr:hypothetical protein [Clostridium sp.]